MSGTYTEARAKAIKKYLANIGEYKLRTDISSIERYKKAAEKDGISLNKYIILAIEEKIDRDSGNK